MQLKEFPVEACKLRLSVIDLSNNSLSGLPPEIGMMLLLLSEDFPENFPYLLETLLLLLLHAIFYHAFCWTFAFVSECNFYCFLRLYWCFFLEFYLYLVETFCCDATLSVTNRLLSVAVVVAMLSFNAIYFILDFFPCHHCTFCSDWMQI